MAIRRAISAALVLHGVLMLASLGCRKSESEAGPSSEPQAAVISAEDVLQKMISAYEAADTYTDTAQYLRQTVRRSEGIQRDTLIYNLSLAVERPNKLRFKSLREYPPSQRNETYDIASDGQLILTACGELPEQIHETLAPDVLTPQNFIPEPNVREAVLQVSLENLYPQLKLLLDSGEEAMVFPADQNPHYLDQQKLRDVECYRIALDNPAGKRILWIDAESFVLLRMELPMEAQLPLFDPYGEYSRYAVLIDYINPRLGKPIDAAKFALAIPEKTKRMRRLVPPPPEAPAAELGRPVAEFSFTTLDGEKVTPASLAGKVALLEFWAQNCPPCRQHTPLLERAYQELKDQTDFAFYAVNMDPASFSNTAASRIYRDWGATIPILRDPQDTAYERLGVRYFPHTILIGRDGRLQFSEAGMHSEVEPLLEKVRKLLANDDLAAEAVAQHARLVERSHADLQAAELVGSLLEPKVARPEIPPRKLPERFELTQRWQISSDKLQHPGDIQVLASRLEGEPQILVLDGGQTVVEVGFAGEIAGRHELPQHAEHANGFMRIAKSEAGPSWCAVSGVGWQQVYIFNDKWQNDFAFPEEKHAGIGDVLFADLTGGSAPLLYVGYRRGGGIQGVTVDGRRAWVNSRLDHALQIAPGPAGDEAKPQAWCTSARGTITRLAVDGKFAGEMSVAGQTITHVGPPPGKESGLTDFCGFSASGNGTHATVGFDAEGDVKWRYELPHGDYLHEVPRIQLAHLPGQGACWLVVAADGSLHWLNNSGEQIARCDYGAPLTGLATVADAEAVWLYVATDKDLTAWEITQKSTAPISEPAVESPSEE